MNALSNLDIESAGATAPENSDDALSLEFTRRHAHELRYVRLWDKWLIYTGTVWRPDEKLSTFNRARVVCREAADVCNEAARKNIASAKTVASVVNLARSEPRHAATVDQWDSDPWFLNTPGGLVDLRTGGMRPNRPDDYMTKITAVAPGGECPIWHDFLNRITGGDEHLEAYLQRLCGYALTGLTTEQALAFLYGTGANGKSVFLGVITSIMGDYFRHAPMEVFMDTGGTQHPTDVAALRGARLVTAIETEHGKRWAEAKIKSLTGSDPVTARFMRQDSFTFIPTFKLIISGNSKPGLRGVDEAIRRRFHLVPFSVTIPPKERDHRLSEKLKAEWPGILQWMILGCLEWQRNGLAPPAAVVEATDAYLEAEDSYGAWLAECGVLDPNAWTPSCLLFASWKLWAERAGLWVGDSRRLTEALESRGMAKRKGTGGTRGVVGIRLESHSERDFPQ